MFLLLAGRASPSPVSRTAYLIRAASVSSGPIVKTAGRLKFSFSTVIAWSDREKSKGVMENLQTRWNGRTIAFLRTMTLSIPMPVIAK
jgi:hypothetical protein